MVLLPAELDLKRKHIKSRKAIKAKAALVDKLGPVAGESAFHC